MPRVELDSQTLQDAHMALPEADGLAMAEELQFDAVECDEAIVFCALDYSCSVLCGGCFVPTIVDFCVAKWLVASQA